MADSIKQSVLIDAMLRPELYPHPVQDCEVIETHISWVILAGDYAYKIKKSLDLGFLDFSSLGKRRFYCEEELRLNRRLAPSVYLQTIAIGGSAQHPVLDVQQGAIEYAVKMRRFAQQAQLDRMLAAGRLQPEHIDAFARMAARFHQAAAVAEPESEFGEPERIWQPVAENFAQIRQHLPATHRESILSALQQWSQRTFQQLEPKLRQRKHAGYIRECHGDMHLRNLAWIDSEAVAFDCIEFNPNLRWIDVISEVAFMVMDLQARGEPGYAQRFLNRYLEITGDYEALALLPFYLVYRALVRAKVAAIASSQTGADSSGHQAALQEFTEYLEIARRYTIPAPRALLMTRGMSASGKSTLTAPLLERLGAIRLRSDVERKRLFGLQAEQDGHAAPGEGIYSAMASERTYERLAQLARAVLAAGYPVVIDAVCQHHAQRERFWQLCESSAVPCLVLEFVAPVEALRARIMAREKEVSDADLTVLQRQLETWQPLQQDEQEFALQVQTEPRPDSDELYRRVSKRLTQLRLLRQQ